MVVHVYSCLLTGIIPVQIRTGIITWKGTGIFMNIEAYSCSWNFRKARQHSAIGQKQCKNEVSSDMEFQHQLMKKSSSVTS